MGREKSEKYPKNKRDLLLFGGGGGEPDKNHCTSLVPCSLDEAMCYAKSLHSYT